MKKYTILFIIVSLLFSIAFVVNLRDKPEPNYFWQLEYAKAKIRADRYALIVQQFDDSIKNLNASMQKRSQTIQVSKAKTDTTKQQLATTADTATIVLLQHTIIAQQDTTITQLDAQLADCQSVVLLQQHIISSKDSIIDENNALLDIANHNIAQIKKDTWIKRNQFTLGVVTGTIATAVVASFIAK